ncbi:MAG: hypothetical protein ABIO94_07415, partial [Opitutaceae bacterium]
MNGFTRRLLSVGAAFFAITLGRFSPAVAQENVAVQVVEVDLRKDAGPLDHIWENAGSDRAVMTLRDQWRKDLTRFHEEAGLKYVRFHGIFNDELGVYAPSSQTRGNTPNWQNVDRVYDGLLERGVKPVVELSFMPKQLASGEAAFGFYRGNITPPKDMAEWSA